MEQSTNLQMIQEHEQEGNLYNTHTQEMEMANAEQQMMQERVEGGADPSKHHVQMIENDINLIQEQ